jgi:tetratricopeptide (TPR) repeat protein
VDRAFDLLHEGQQESAHKLFQELLQAHQNSAAVWLYYASFLAEIGQWDQAESAIDEALRRHPQLGMAYYQRGQLREHEGELPGALMLYHKAADLIAPEAKDQLLEAYLKIVKLGSYCRQYLAVRYALDRAMQLRPDLPNLHQLHEKLTGPDSGLPLSARQRHSLRRTRQPIAESHLTGRLSDARIAYEQLVQRTPQDPAAWFNLGLILAWQGENQRAVEAFYRSLDVESDDRLAEQTGALLEVLLSAQGMEAQANYLEYVFSMTIRDPQRFWQVFDDKRRQGLISHVELNEEAGMIRGLFIEEIPTLVMSEHTPLYRIRASFFIVPPQIHLVFPVRDQVAALAQELYEQSQMALEPPRELAKTFEPQVMKVLYFTLLRPGEQANPDVRQRQRQYVADYFENIWLHQPLKSLEGNSPLNAAANPRLRKRVFGAVRFMEECYRANFGLPDETSVGSTSSAEQQQDHYDFQSLRDKLGLEYTSVAVTEPETLPMEAAGSLTASSQDASTMGFPSQSTVQSPSATTPPRNISALNVAELAALDHQALSVEEIEQAMRAALRLEARELAVAFARSGVDKPFDPNKPDRYPLYAAAITGALVQGNYTEALQLVQRGEQYDSEHNHGARAIDYALKRANVYVRMKDVEHAVEAFDRLIAQYPHEGRLYTTAAEEMLRLKAAEKARYFADRGLRLAHQSQNRDLEEHCRELLAAAEKAR